MNLRHLMMNHLQVNYLNTFRKLSDNYEPIDIIWAIIISRIKEGLDEFKF